LPARARSTRAASRASCSRTHRRLCELNGRRQRALSSKGDVPSSESGRGGGDRERGGVVRRTSSEDQRREGQRAIGDAALLFTQTVHVSHTRRALAKASDDGPWGRGQGSAASRGRWRPWWVWQR
jgi:hypothetical protein